MATTTLMPAIRTSKTVDTMTVINKDIMMTTTTINTMTKVHLLLVSINSMLKAAMEPSHADEVTILRRIPRLSLISP